MLTIKKIIVSSFSVVLTLVAFAQNVENVFDLCGQVYPGEELTREQITSYFGEPVEYSRTEYEENDILVDEYKYNGLVIEIIKGYGVTTFYVTSPDYPVATSMVTKSGLRVGQSFGDLKRYPFTDFLRHEDLENGEYKGCEYYTFTIKGQKDSSIMSVVVKNGIITELGYNFQFV